MYNQNKQIQVGFYEEDIKSKIALEELKGEKSIAEIASEFGVYLKQVGGK